MRFGAAATVAALTAATAGAVIAPRAAHACGGCFAPTETNQVVTDHRMVMAVHADQSILWDQIRYTGSPEDFSWVLPVNGAVTVEIASDEFFNELEQATAVRVQAPPVQFCRGTPSGGVGCGAAGSAPRSAGGVGGGMEDSVQVLNMASVGPYQTVTLRSSDTGALTTWLRTNRYTVPPSIEPVIQWYTERHMDFVALRLRPGVGIQAMQPVRITFATPNMVLPLRMVAAGVADKVGVALWVFAPSRFEAVNFANAQVDPGELVWDWNTNRSNYRDVFNNTLRRTAGGRAWITEFSGPALDLARQSSRSASSRDWQLAQGTSAGGGSTVTRLRTDLAVGFLDADLILQPSISGQAVSNQLRALRETGPNPGASCGGIVTVATPADMARRPGSVLAGIAASALALVIARRKARKKG